MYKTGQEYDLSEQEIQTLLEQGYELDLPKAPNGTELPPIRGDMQNYGFQKPFVPKWSSRNIQERAKQQFLQPTPYKSEAQKLKDDFDLQQIQQQRNSPLGKLENSQFGKKASEFIETAGNVALLMEGGVGVKNIIKDAGKYVRSAITKEPVLLQPKITQQHIPWYKNNPKISEEQALQITNNGVFPKNLTDAELKQAVSELKYHPYEYGGEIEQFKQGGKLSQNQYLKQRGLVDANDKGDFDNMSTNSARKILHAKKVNGKKLTPEQNRLFGYLSKGNTLKYEMGGEIQPIPYNEGDELDLTVAQIKQLEKQGYKLKY